MPDIWLITIQMIKIDTNLFAQELADLCRKHKVYLSITWDSEIELFELKDGADPLEFAPIVDTNYDR